MRATAALRAPIAREVRQSFGKKSLLDLIAIKQDLEDLLHYPVDVVTENGLSPYRRDGIMAEARLLTA